MSDWEKSVIGTVLSDPASFDAAGDLLPSDFTGPNKVIWAEMMILHNQGGLELRALINRLNDSPERDQLFGIGNLGDYLNQCLAFRGTAIQTYADQVLAESIRRKLRSNAALIAAEAENNQRTIDELLDYAENHILQLRRNRDNEGMTLGDIIATYIPRLEGQRAGTIQPAWTPYTVAVRQYIPALEGTDFMVVASRPGEGKSSYMRFEALRASKEGGWIDIFNLENDPNEYPRFMIALETGIDAEMLKPPHLATLSPVNFERVKEAAESLAHLPMKIYTLGNANADRIVRMARKSISEHHTQIIIVDYIQLISNGLRERVDDVSETTRKLRGLAMDFHVPVMAASQLNREIEKRGNDNSDPQLSDLRDSGSLEQDSTIVMFPRSWRNPTRQQLETFPENRQGQSTEIVAVPVWFHVLKNRNGKIGVTDAVKWNKSTNNYQTLQRGAVAR